MEADMGRTRYLPALEWLPYALGLLFVAWKSLGWISWGWWLVLMPFWGLWVLLLATGILNGVIDREAARRAHAIQRRLEAERRQRDLIRAAIEDWKKSGLN